MARNRHKTVLMVDDDMYLIEPQIDTLERDGYHVITARTGKSALKELQDRRGTIDVVTLDIMMPWDKSAQRLVSQRLTGWALAKRLKKEFPHIKLIGFSILGDESVIKWFEEFGAGYLQKPVRPIELLDAVHSAIYGKARRKPKCFIVHGHDEKSLKELIHVLRTDLGFKDIVILGEQASHGQTIIEKFEELVHTVDLAFVLLTPDDVGFSERVPKSAKRRARQNVIFELGYLYSHLYRKKGRVILLYAGELDLPSDISGLIYIDISQGIGNAKKQLRKELSIWL